MRRNHLAVGLAAASMALVATGVANVTEGIGPASDSGWGDPLEPFGRKSRKARRHGQKLKPNRNHISKRVRRKHRRAA